MANKSTAFKRESMQVTINRNWQIAFIATMFGSQLLVIGSLLWTYFRYTHYMSLGTWLFQIIQFAYPIVFFAVGYLFVRSSVRGRLARTFWATLLATMAYVINGGLQFPLNTAISALHISLLRGSNDPSIWNAFGIVWIQLAIFFVLYCGVLWYIFKRNKRA